MPDKPMKRIWIPLLAVVCLLLGVLAATILRRADDADAALRETAETLGFSKSKTDRLKQSVLEKLKTILTNDGFGTN